ncbi:glycoside hydrolase family 3 C-terminal domain-containing protein [Bifidobacterium sp. ESL0728]|uniref:glycoside hydrolase family 3 N-terminal domain-containing protein n=1 Tax=Bifidobacterium sp. ESL0728 TaxID=2983220 RepID=UPI0023F72E0F|nr:glycoside hydrolase family 3 N-terminal domain-containing protein [Bifidobacterium sp. ESL0728]WEV59554.1 glycoside hydrolase family 3 C-terminal domain-containing protein [Bifidobacterium sp. ESL0728]
MVFESNDSAQIPDKAQKGNEGVMPWQNENLPAAARAKNLVSRMTTHEKVSQLTSIWSGATNEGYEVAPQQNELMQYIDFDEAISDGIGQFTRPYGTAPVDPAVGAKKLEKMQRRAVSSNRFGIPALVHEECLTGFTTYGATTYPIPLSWGATFNPSLIEQMAARIGRNMASLGVHQGLSPLMDVVKDLRWGRCEETIGEDPLLVGTIGTAYVKGLQSSGVIATLKHFVGYATSKGGKNHSPSQISTRELLDVFLPPFEMAIKEGHAQSVMPAYTAIDGIPCSANRDLLTDVLRKCFGFKGTTVSDYFAIIQLATNQHIAASNLDAAIQSFCAGMDVELPGLMCFDEDFEKAVDEGVIPQERLDEAVVRVLTQKIEIGLLDQDWNPEPKAIAHVDDEKLEGSVNLDEPQNRALARKIAEEAIILLKNDGILPLKSHEYKKIAVVGPAANDNRPLFGCYSFERHVRTNYPEKKPGICAPTLLEKLKEYLPDCDISYAQGASIMPADADGYPDETDLIAQAVENAKNADLVITVVGDIAGLFGNGTTGEGSDSPDLRLSGHQEDLVKAIEKTHTPNVIVLLTGKPRVVTGIYDEADAILQTFYPGEEGASALSEVLVGEVNPSGKLPVSIPKESGTQPATYLSTPIERNLHVTNIDEEPMFPFGYGLSYTDWELSEFSVSAKEIPTTGSVDFDMRLTNTGNVEGSQVVQLYVNDPVSSVVRPIEYLAGFCKVELAAGASEHIRFHLPTEVLSFTGRDYRRIVEPGRIVLKVGFDSGKAECTTEIQVTGPVREIQNRKVFGATAVIGDSNHSTKKEV